MRLSRLFQRREKAPVYLGLDISDHAVRLFCLTQTAPLSIGAHSLSDPTWVEIPFEQQAMEGPDILDSGCVAKAVAEAAAQLKVTGQSVHLALPEERIFRQRVQIDHAASQSTLEMQEAAVLRAVADKLPVPLDTLRCDFQTVGPSREDPHRLEVQVVACRKSTLAARCKVAQAGKLKVTAVEPESQTLARAMQMAWPSEVGFRMLLYLNTSALTTLILEKNQMKETRTERLRISHPLSQLARQLKTHLNALMLAGGYHTLDELYCVGSHPLLASLEKQARGVLGLPEERAPIALAAALPWQGVDLDARRWFLAAGLAWYPSENAVQEKFPI